MTDMCLIEEIMGTAIIIDVRAAEMSESQLGEIIEGAFSRLREIDARFSTYREDSEITLLGRGELSIDDCHEDVRFVIDLCETIRQSTNGAFDIHAAGLTSPAFDLQSTGSSPNPIEPSGVVKGWAIEQAGDILRCANIRDFCINAGGDIYVSGSESADHHWRVGLQHPLEKMSLMAVLDVTDTAIATSGEYERGEHIVTEDTSAELLSLTITGSDMTLADAYATAAFAMGVKGIEWASSLPGFHVFAVDKAGMTHRSRGMNAYLVDS